MTAGDAHLSDFDLQSADLRVRALAGFALSALAAGSFAKQADCCSSEVKDLLDALTMPDDAIYQQLLLNTIASGCTSDDLIDQTIPDLARRLGDGWSADTLSFADVSIGVSRLQKTVRQHGALKEVDGLKHPLGRRVLLILPETEQHSLGTFIVANQMRRLGVWVQLALGQKHDQIKTLVKDQGFAMIGVSVGGPQTRDHVSELTTILRETGTNAPIILGGADAIKDPDISAADLGADYIAKTTLEALDFCQIDTARTVPTPFEISHF